MTGQSPFTTIYRAESAIAPSRVMGQRDRRFERPDGESKSAPEAAGESAGTIQENRNVPAPRPVTIGEHVQAKHGHFPGTGECKWVLPTGIAWVYVDSKPYVVRVEYLRVVDTPALPPTDVLVTVAQPEMLLLPAPREFVSPEVMQQWRDNRSLMKARIRTRPDVIRLPANTQKIPAFFASHDTHPRNHHSIASQVEAARAMRLAEEGDPRTATELLRESLAMPQAPDNGQAPDPMKLLKKLYK